MNRSPAGDVSVVVVDPASILYIPGDMAALADHADAIRAAGVGFAATGEQIHATWQGLAAVYRAPEADQLLAATGPVKAVSASAGEDMQSAAAALTQYAADVTAIQARLDDLRSRATALQHDIATATATAVYEGFRPDPTLDARQTELIGSTADAVAAWEAAQLQCAARLHAVSSPTPLVGAASVLQNSPFTAPGQNPDETLRTPIGPRGPTTEIFPIEIGLLGTGGIGFTPRPSGPEILVNVPAPSQPLTTGGIATGPPPILGTLLDRASGAAAGKADPPGLLPADELIARGQRLPTGNLPAQGGPPNGVMYKQNPQTGELARYTVYDENGNAIKRVDLIGKPHGGVPTPHVAYYRDEVGPDGRLYTKSTGRVRDALPEEIP